MVGLRNASQMRGTLQQQCNQSMALTSEQVYKLGAESLGWNNSSTAGKALIAEDMALLQRLQLANAMTTDGSPPTLYVRMAVPLTALAPSADHRCC